MMKVLTSKKIADYLGSNHRNIYIDEFKYIESIKKISKIYCEPFF